MKISRRSILGTLAAAGAASGALPLKAGAQSAPAPHAHGPAAGHVQHDGANFVVGSVDHVRNDFDPHKIVSEFDTGTLVTDPDGRTVREWEVVAVDKPSRLELEAVARPFGKGRPWEARYLAERHTLAALLNRPAIELIRAHSGTEALEALLAHDIALALLDQHARHCVVEGRGEGTPEQLTDELMGAVGRLMRRG